MSTGRGDGGSGTGVAEVRARPPYPTLRVVGSVVTLLMVGGTTLGTVPSLLEQRQGQSEELPAAMTRLVVTSSSGDVQVRELVDGSRTPRVESDARYTLSRPLLEVQESGGTVSVEAPCSGTNLGVCSADLTVWVPAGTDLEVDSTFGDVRLSSTGTVDARTTTGDVRLEGEPVTATLTSTLGSVDLDVREPPDEVRVRTTLGDVSLRLPGDERYAVTVSEDSELGDVDVQVPRDPDSAHTVDVGTTLGSIDVRASG